ncbi:MAG: RNA-binding protein, partial [Pseudolabrys sp.]
RDGAEDGKRKINAYVRGGSADLPVIEAFSVEQLDLALGRANVVHAALLAGPATTTFVARASRLARFRAQDEV